MNQCCSLPASPLGIDLEGGEVVTIDGPAGAGKSTVARMLAAALGFAFLDTGAMYRAVTLACMKKGLLWDDKLAIFQLANQVSLRMENDRIFLDGHDVSDEIRQPSVTRNIHYIADDPDVRRVLRLLQRRLAVGQRLVTEGRDQGTEVFPDARCKIFLTASSQTRAERRWRELVNRGQDVELMDVLADQEERDRKDSSRPVGALRPADDAVLFATDGLSQVEVVKRLVELCKGSE